MVRIKDPYGLKSDKMQNNYYLAEGLFVDIKLQGNTVSNVFAIPARTLRENSCIWIMNADRRLEIRKVEIIRREKKQVFVRGDLNDGEQLILTYLSGAAPGMKLRIAEEK